VGRATADGVEIGERLFSTKQRDAAAQAHEGWLRHRGTRQDDERK